MEKLTKDDLVRAKEETKAILKCANPALELAKVIGIPFDPKKRVINVADEIFAPDTAGKGEDVYVFTAEGYNVSNTDLSVDYIVTMDSTGAIVSVAASPDTPQTITFADFTSKEYYVTIKDLARGKYDVLARKKALIGRSLDKLESYKALLMIEAAVPGGNKFDLDTGETRFKWTDFVDMLDAIGDVSDGSILLVGKTIAKDIIRWKYDEDKNIDFFPEENYLNVAKGQIGRIGHVRVIVLRGSIDIELRSAPGEADVTKKIIADNVAYLLGDKNTLGLVIRHELEGGGTRLVLPSSPVMAVGQKRILAYGVVGYEMLQMIVTNPLATAKFTREVG